MQPTPNDRLALLYHLSQTFNSTLDLDEVLNRVMDEVIAAVHAERGFVMLQDENGKLIFRVARGIDQKTIEDPQFQVSRGVIERVARELQPLMSSDAQTDTRFSSRQSVMILGLRSILCTPILLKEKFLGLIYVDNRLQAGIFSPADLELMAAIASSAAAAIENARLYQVAVEKGRMERELQMARKVQASLLPAETPRIPGWQFAARWQPAREVGGDYYDFIQLDNDQWGFVIADVTDKGMPAALFMASTRSIVRASLDRAGTPAEGIGHANCLICEESENRLFVTLFYAALDPQTGDLTYVNAGHNPPLHYQCTNDNRPASLALLAPTGLPLGVEEDTPYRQHTLRLLPGDFMILYTDGVTDAINALDQDFGMERLKHAILRSPQAGAAEILSVLVKSIQTFTGEAAPIDDITIVVIKRMY